MVDAIEIQVQCRLQSSTRKRETVVVDRRVCPCREINMDVRFDTVWALCAHEEARKRALDDNLLHDCRFWRYRIRGKCECEHFVGATRLTYDL